MSTLLWLASFLSKVQNTLFIIVVVRFIVLNFSKLMCLLCSTHPASQPAFISHRVEWRMVEIQCVVYVSMHTSCALACMLTSGTVTSSRTMNTMSTKSLLILSIIFRFFPLPREWHIFARLFSSLKPGLVILSLCAATFVSKLPQWLLSGGTPQLLKYLLTSGEAFVLVLG